MIGLIEDTRDCPVGLYANVIFFVKMKGKNVCIQYINFSATVSTLACFFLIFLFPCMWKKMTYLLMGQFKIYLMVDRGDQKASLK